MQYSLLDLAPVAEGSDAATAIKQSGDLAQHAERWGYHRYWLAEHHNMPGIASAATAVLIGHIASLTNTMRIGAGGIMLPNHAPLAVAEAFGTLATMYPDRIDLGLGRAPGGDHAVLKAMGVTAERSDRFPDEVAELQRLFGPLDETAAVNAHPGADTNVPLWILGSSLYGAQVAAYFGLPYAFASHFAPAALEQAFAVYRDKFRPSAVLQKPHAMMAVNVFAAETEAEAIRLQTTMQQAFYRLRSGQPGKMQPPVDRIEDVVPPQYLAGVNDAMRVTVTGTADQIETQMRRLIDTYHPDEVILSGHIYDHAARLRSYEIAAEVMGRLNRKEAA